MDVWNHVFILIKININLVENNSIVLVIVRIKILECALLADSVVLLLKNIR